MLSIISKYNKTIIMALAALMLALFSYGSSPGLIPDSLAFYNSLPGDLGPYANRFAGSLLFFAIIPLIFIGVNRMPLSSLGLSKPVLNPLGDSFFPLLMVLCLVIGISGSYDSALSAFYPYSKTLSQWAASGEWRYLLLHTAFYSLFYYLPWEIFFRGFLIMPFLDKYSPGNYKMTPQLLMIASMQAIPSSLLHFGHPISETIGAIPFGILCGWLVLRYRSIYPGLILHIISGVTLDIFITLQSGGIL